MSLEKGAAYLGVTKSALRAAIQRGQMPGHKTRSNPEDEKSDGTWWFNAKARDELADELLECEPPEWHNWKSYWTYDRKKRKFSPANKEDCQTVKGKQVYSPEFQNWSNSKTTSPAKHENDQQYHQCRFEHYIHELGVVVIYLLGKLTGQKERFIVLNVHYVAAYSKGLFPIVVGAGLTAFVIWLIR